MSLPVMWFGDWRHLPVSAGVLAGDLSDLVYFTTPNHLRVSVQINRDRPSYPVKCVLKRLRQFVIRRAGR